jgi:uncharacterized membrane protein YhaH (DUF805 family)
MVASTHALAMSWFLLAVSKYATFSGRARRKEYWFFILFYLLSYLVAVVIDSVIVPTILPGIQGFLSLILAFGLMLPGFAVAARRLHDLGKSGWWQLLNFVPLIGPAILIIWLARKGTAGPNSFGPDPLA